MTDRTSPWSSMVSDTEPDFIEHNPKTGETSPADSPTGGDHSDLLSQVVYKIDQFNTFSSDGSCGSQRTDRDPSCAQNDNEADDGQELQVFSVHRIPQPTSDHSDGEGSDHIGGEAEITSADLETDDAHVHEESENPGAEEERRSQGDYTHPDTSPSEEELTDPADHPQSGHLLYPFLSSDLYDLMLNLLSDKEVLHLPGISIISLSCLTVRLLGIHYLTTTVFIDKVVRQKVPSNQPVSDH